MARFRVIRKKTIVLAEVYEVEGENSEDAILTEGELIFTAPVSEDTEDAAVTEKKNFDFAWLRKKMKKLKGKK